MRKIVANHSSQKPSLSLRMRPKYYRPSHRSVSRSYGQKRLLAIQVLRQYYDLGVRYVTLTHMCHNAFADSCGFEPGLEPRWGGLSKLGYSLIEEMNRIGMLVDLSHTSDDTAKQALKHTKAPVIWSHSSARAVHDVPRNVPNDVLELIGTGVNKTDAVVMVKYSRIL